MACIDLHSKPFDEGTITKLEIFENYAKAWIPTFVMSGRSKICIFDFFAGTGYDKNGVPGSPIRILEQIKKFIGNIFQNNVNVCVFLNEFNADKFHLLESSCNKYLAINPDVKRAIDIHYFNEDFELLFPQLLPLIKMNPSLVYLDQNGIKFLSEKYFLELEKTIQTDFLYFLSSSYFWRFGDSPEFKMNLNINMDDAKKDPYKFIHRSILEQIRNKLPSKTKLSLYPFTIKKSSNIYGIIFGASHPRAVDKFLKIAWDANNINGEANFDIDDDISKKQYLLFDKPKLTKIQYFCKTLREEILSGKISNNKDAYLYTINHGHIAAQASDEVKRMKTEDILDFKGRSPLINYDQVFKNNRIINFLIK
ncbi:three-Cys-motif partner protein TcmP [uncultured Bacteroides sp.]|uniref:three-Cys-motif partner protein TcmP n=1 Tax=uncultured Bacteroides sp. TaxID=162156 RepID=UPI002AAAA067|nr:three-Cys-motif partner protein TcmP [uncultured Bacteroides sp.]